MSIQRKENLGLKTTPGNGERRDPVALEYLRSMRPFLWLNPHLNSDPLGAAFIDEGVAERRFARNEAALEKLFPAFAATGGRLQSALVRCDGLKHRLIRQQGVDPDPARGTWWIKRDDLLPVSGSIKTRGAIHEILKLAEYISTKYGFRKPNDSAGLIISEETRGVFARHTVIVGSTGNLGLAVGLVASAFGFKAIVHMSHQAKAWKKERLRVAGVEVVEHKGDYASAVDGGRIAAKKSPNCFFIDDERSEDLFLGYAAVAAELETQFDECGIVVGEEHPLFVYVPCGVGGAPGGICYGLKRKWGQHVHFFFAQPCASPAVLVHFASGADQPISVYDVGLSNKTEADGLAVAEASKLAMPLVRSILSGIFTVDDETLMRDLYLVARAEGVRVEPSAVAAMRGPMWVTSTPVGRDYLASRNLLDRMTKANHIIWSTGGLLIPKLEQSRYECEGRLLAEQALLSSEEIKFGSERVRRTP